VARSNRRIAERPPLRPGAPGLSPGIGKRTRILPRERTERLQRIGLETNWWRDIYHEAVTASWRIFLAVAVAVYLIANVIFACLYLLQPGAIGQAKPGDFGDAFFFSVQTMATIGYGKLTPDTVYANLLVTLQTVFAMLLLAVTTGLIFARFSRPTARVMFTRNVVIGPHNGTPTLSFRMANERSNQILQAEISVAMLRTEDLLEGGTIRRLYDLKLMRSRSPVFALSFQAMHPIDTDSPLFGATIESLEAQAVEFIVIATGIDATTSQTVHTHHSYSLDDLLWHHRFADIFGYTEEGRAALDFRLFHDTIPVTASRAAAAGAGTD
jgi:inward rectifier potassium channel